MPVPPKPQRAPSRLEAIARASLSKRATAILRTLAATYPDAHCELDFDTPLQLLIATILSAQCTDKRVNMVTPALFARFPAAADFAGARVEEIETLIHSTGFYRSKAKNIRAACRQILEKHNGKVPDTMEALKALPGVGRKTANVVLGNAFNKAEGVVVDTHVGRLSRRLELTGNTDPVKVENDLIQLIPRSHWTLFSHWLIWHGRRRCTARNPDCTECELLALCPTGKAVVAAVLGK